MPRPAVIIIDGLALACRYHFAMSRMNFFTNRAGQPSTVLLGFHRLLNSICRPDMFGDRVFVAFDASKIDCYRRLSFENYKASRAKLPPAIYAQIPDTMEMCRAYGCEVVSSRRFEADDIIATAAHTATELKIPTIVCSPDKDFMQIVNQQVHVWKTGPLGASTPSSRKAFLNQIAKLSSSALPFLPPSESIFTPAEVFQRYEVTPEQFVDFQILCGDACDNYSGVRGIGPVTSVSLLSQFGSLERLLKELRRAIKSKTSLGLKPKVEETLSRLALAETDAADQCSFGTLRRLATLGCREADPAGEIAVEWMQNVASDLKSKASYYHHRGARPSNIPVDFLKLQGILSENDMNASSQRFPLWMESHFGADWGDLPLHNIADLTRPKSSQLSGWQRGQGSSQQAVHREAELAEDLASRHGVSQQSSKPDVVHQAAMSQAPVGAVAVSAASSKKETELEAQEAPAAETSGFETEELECAIVAAEELALATAAAREKKKAVRQAAATKKKPTVDTNQLACASAPTETKEKSVKEEAQEFARHGFAPLREKGHLHARMLDLLAREKAAAKAKAARKTAEELLLAAQKVSEEEAAAEEAHFHMVTAKKKTAVTAQDFTIESAPAMPQIASQAFIQVAMQPSSLSLQILAFSRLVMESLSVKPRFMESLSVKPRFTRWMERRR